MNCPDCKKETILMNGYTPIDGVSWFICSCGTITGITQATQEVLEAHYPDRINISEVKRNGN